MQEVYEFQAEINQLLSIIINTFYSNKDVFLRELISNAADAIDKIRHIELCAKDTVKNHLDDHRITIRLNTVDQTVTVEDTGLGMSKDDLINNLGVIAKSGTKAFMEALKDSEKMSLIGQFGVGFYASYLVADTVQVFSKKYDEDKCYKWESRAGGTFTITECETDIVRGTRIVLFLKPDNPDYIEHTKITQLVKKYNDFIEYPIMVEYDVEEDAPAEEEEAEEAEEDEGIEEIVVNEVEQEMTVDEIEKEETEEKEPVEPKPEKEKEEKKPKKIIVTKREKANNQKPLWHKTPSETTSEEYDSLYKCLTSDWNTYLALKHFSVEGQLEFKSILFLPKVAPRDMFNGGATKQDNIKLYVKKVYITDDAEKLIPSYMSFIKGVVDTDDLPLNISREMLQENKIVKQIRKAITKRVLEMINELNETDFDTFYQNFSKNIKLGAYEDATNREKLMELLRFSSTNDKEKMTSLKDYVSRMKEGQKTIYYITGESRAFVEASPFLKRVDGEVIFMTDPIDEYMMHQCRKYNDYTFVCITKVGADENKMDETEQDKFKLFCDTVHDIVGKSKLSKVQINRYDKNIPCIVMTDTYGYSANMERIMKAQTLSSDNPMAMIGSKKTLELNVDNELVSSLYEKFTQDATKLNKNIINLVYETALISSGFNISEPSSYSQKIFNIIKLGLNGDDEPEESSEGSPDSPDSPDSPVVDDTGADVSLESLD
jgi:molecular chaperone HtpG